MVDIRRKDGAKKTLSVLAILIFIVYTFFSVRAVMNYEEDLDGQKIITEYQLFQVTRSIFSWKK